MSFRQSYSIRSSLTSKYSCYSLTSSIHSLCFTIVSSLWSSDSFQMSLDVLFSNLITFLLKHQFPIHLPPLSNLSILFLLDFLIFPLIPYTCISSNLSHDLSKDTSFSYHQQCQGLESLISMHKAMSLILSTGVGVPNQYFTNEVNAIQRCFNNL